jgi:hypothetical protein
MARAGRDSVVVMGSGRQVAERVEEHLADLVGTVENLGVGEAQAAQAGPRVGLVAAEVDRLLGGGAVMAEAVGLDDETESGPEEIDPIAPEPTPGRFAT